VDVVEASTTCTVGEVTGGIEAEGDDILSRASMRFLTRSMSVPVLVYVIARNVTPSVVPMTTPVPLAGDPVLVVTGTLRLRERIASVMLEPMSGVGALP